MAERMFDIQHDREQGRITVSINWPKLRIFPAARGHVRVAAKETLLGFRSLIDDAVSIIGGEEEKK